jgi:hypothetical protein
MLTLLMASSPRCSRSNPPDNTPFYFPMSATTIDADSIDPWPEVVRQQVAAIRCGSVQIIEHVGRATRVESLEKTRFALCDGSYSAVRKPRRA